MGAPCEVWFYHLERTGVDQALPELLEKTVARGWRALVCCGVRERLEQLDRWLWTYRDDSFLPHGVGGGEADVRQPILLALEGGAADGREAVFLVDGAEPPPLDGVARCVVLFDGRDEAALADARARWRAVKAQGHGASYWRQSEEGAWRKEA